LLIRSEAKNQGSAKQVLILSTEDVENYELNTLIADCDAKHREIFLKGGKGHEPVILYSFANKFRMRNTGLTYCKKDGAKWSIEAFNDHRHLG
jgi:hypothetical protein